MRLLTEIHFIIRRTTARGPMYVIAPPGWTRSSQTGTLYRDGSLQGGPEWGDRKHAHLFRSHRAAARVANKCLDVRIETVTTDLMDME